MQQKAGAAAGYKGSDRRKSTRPARADRRAVTRAQRNRCRRAGRRQDE